MNMQMMVGKEFNEHADDGRVVNQRHHALLHTNDFWNYIRDVTNQRNRQTVDAAISLADADVLPIDVNCNKNNFVDTQD